MTQLNYINKPVFDHGAVNKISEILKVVLNVAQNSLGDSTEKVFTNSALQLLKKSNQ